MSWLTEHKSIWRMIILYLLLIAFVGPWSAESIHVPAQYDCSGLNFRLEGDYCGTPLSGIRVFAVGFDLVSDTIEEIITDAPSPVHLARNPWIFFIIPLLLPVFGTLLLLLSRERLRLHMFQATLWGLAACGSLGLLWLFSFTRRLPPIQLWGLWGYIVLALVALILEIVTLIKRKSAYHIL